MAHLSSGRFLCLWKHPQPCLQTFSIESDLTWHAIVEHIRTSKPMPKSEAIRRKRTWAEVDISDDSNLQASVLQNSVKQDNCQQPQELSSSLPTPPGSDAASPPNPKSISLPAAMDIMPEIFQDTGVDPSLLSGPMPSPLRAFTVSRVHSRVGSPNPTPTFKSLAELPGSPQNPENPPTPQLSEMVEDALRSPKRQRTSNGMMGISSRHSSLDSESSVANRLTQMSEDEEMDILEMIHADKLQEFNDEPVEGQQAPDGDSQQYITAPVNSLSSTQERHLYDGDIFKTQTQASDHYAEYAPTPSFGPQVSHSTPKGNEPSPENSGPNASTSSDLSAPPGNQLALQAQGSQAEHSQFQEDSQGSTKSNSSNNPFFRTSSQRPQPFYAVAPPPNAGEPSSVGKASIYDSPPKGSVRRVKASSQSRRHLSGTMSFNPPRAAFTATAGGRPIRSSNTTLTRATAHLEVGEQHRRQEARLGHGVEFRSSGYELEGVDGSQSQAQGPSQGDDWDSSQASGDLMGSLPPLMTQAPFGSQS